VISAFASRHSIAVIPNNAMLSTSAFRCVESVNLLPGQFSWYKVLFDSIRMYPEINLCQIAPDIPAELFMFFKRFGSVTAVVAGQPVTPAYVHCLHDVEMDTGHEGFFRRNRGSWSVCTKAMTFDLKPLLPSLPGRAGL